MKGKIEINDKAVKGLSDAEKPNEVVKKVKTSSDYFNTLTENEKEPNLIKAIIDENVKAVDGSRVRLRLLDDIEIGENRGAKRVLPLRHHEWFRISTCQG